MAVPHPTPHIPLAEIIVNALADDPVCPEKLRELLGPAQDHAASQPPPAYTVTGLAQALGVTCRVVRSAIARGELPAVKRGGRWYVDAEAVAAWTNAEAVLPRRHPRAARRAAKPDDTAVGQILSPYPSDHSAVSDCAKLAESTFAARKAVMVYGFNSEKRPVEALVDAFELLARDLVMLGERHSACFGPLVHPVHHEGTVWLWEVQRRS